MRRPDMAVRALTAGEADAKDPARRLVNWNEYEGPFFTIRMGGGVLYEYADYSQDENSTAQIDLTPKQNSATLASCSRDGSNSDGRHVEYRPDV